MFRTKLYWLSRLMALAVPGDSATGVCDSLAGGETTGGREVLTLVVESPCGRDMDNSSSLIADDMMELGVCGGRETMAVQSSSLSIGIRVWRRDENET